MGCGLQKAKPLTTRSEDLFTKVKQKKQYQPSEDLDEKSQTEKASPQAPLLLNPEDLGNPPNINEMNTTTHAERSERQLNTLFPSYEIPRIDDDATEFDFVKRKKRGVFL